MGPVLSLKQEFDSRTGETVSVSQIAEMARLAPADALVVAGTLVEGIGNPFSDFDVIVLCHEPPTVSRFRDGYRHRMYAVGDKKFVSQNLLFGHAIDDAPDESLVINTYDTVTEWGTRCDVEYLTIDRVNTLIDRLERGYEKLKKSYSRASSGLSEDEYKLLHRLKSGLILQQSDALSKLLGRIDNAMQAYCLYRASLPSWASIQDMLGFYFSNRDIEFFDLAAVHLHNVAACYAHSLGYTNPARKWTYTFLAACSDDTCAQAIVDLARTIRVGPTTLSEVAVQVSDLTDEAHKLMFERLSADNDYPDPSSEAKALQKSTEASGLSDLPFLLAAEYFKRQCAPAALPLKAYFDKRIFDGHRPLPENLGRFG